MRPTFAFLPGVLRLATSPKHIVKLPVPDLGLLPPPPPPASSPACAPPYWAPREAPAPRASRENTARRGHPDPDANSWPSNRLRGDPVEDLLEAFGQGLEYVDGRRLEQLGKHPPPCLEAW
eukprot:429655-Pyramimonas_sp.AAC.1